MAETAAAPIEEQPVLVDLTDGIMTITLNRPSRHNAVSAEMAEAFKAALVRANADPAVRVVLLEGAGRSFCSGGDVSDMAEADDTSAKLVLDSMLARGEADYMLGVKQPIVAAVHGYAMGLGATIALMSDIVIAADDSTIADTHVRVGLAAGDGGAVIWPLAASLSTAKYYLLTGDRMSGKEAERVGLVFKSVPAEELKETALAICRKLAALPPLAVVGTKATLNLIVRERNNLLIEHGLLAEGATMISEDHQEAAAAFVEKRPGVFHNR